MHDPIAASRQTALRAVAVEAVFAVVLSAIFLLQGVPQALAAGAGGLAMLLGNALSAHVALGGIVPARVAFGRLMLGVVLKWVVAMSVFAMALMVWRLPPIPMVTGLAAGLLAYLLALNFLSAKR